MRQQPPGGRGSGVPMTNTCALQRPRTSEDSFLPHTWAESLYKTRRSSGGRAAGSQRGDPCQLSGSSLARGKAAGSHQPEQECQATVWVQRAWVHLPRHPCWATGFFLLGRVRTQPLCKQGIRVLIWARRAKGDAEGRGRLDVHFRQGREGAQEPGADPEEFSSWKSAGDTKPETSTWSVPEKGWGPKTAPKKLKKEQMHGFHRKQRRPSHSYPHKPSPYSVNRLPRFRGIKSHI